jgi:ABC-type bacteriocin/lantibiotic exporter with double-glycine peptidase domain
MSGPENDRSMSWLGLLETFRKREGREPDFSWTLRSLLALGWVERRFVLPALVAAVVLAGLALLPPVLLAGLIDRAFPDRHVALGVAIGVGIACVALIDAACSFARRMLAARAGLNLQRDMLAPAFRAVLRLPVDHRLARDQGLLGRIFEETERLAQNATEGLIEFGMAAGMIFVLVATLVFVDWRTALAIVVIVGLLAALHVAASRTLRVRETTWFEARSHYWSHLVESIAYINTVRFNSAHRFAEGRFVERLEGDLAARLATIRLSTGLDAAGRLATGLIVAVIALLGGARVMHGGMSVGDFVLVLSMGGSLSAPVLALVKAFDDFQATTISVDRLSKLAEARCEDISVAGEPAPKGAGQLAVENLNFAYSRDGAPVLSGLSCVIAPGERVALVGPSGIGKSTLASLIFAARQPDSGVIRFDGTPIGRIPLAELRRRIVIVPHEIDVFTGTVAENIALESERSDPVDIEDAARVAGIDSDIRSLPQGYGTLLGQGGVELSAGQKQRLGIARAILREPDILVLDESTSSLDLATERRVIDEILKRLSRTTIIAITHRSSVVERMERAIRLS